MGEDPIPDVPVNLNVKEFGAKGDGITDDSKAFLQAIEAIEDGAIYIPPGRYKITKVLEINKSNVVLRGAGTEATVLYFPEHLGDVVGPGDAPLGTPYWAWHGGLIKIQGADRSRWLANVITGASRGDKSLQLSSTSRVEPGQTILFHQPDPGDGSYLKHLHAEQLEGGSYTGQNFVHFVSRVKDVRGDTVILERPLRTDVRLEWKPHIRDFGPTVFEVGIEDLTMEFPQGTYSKHLKEPGYNGIEVVNASDCWLRNLKFLNADNGIFLQRTHFCTISGVYFGASEGRPVRQSQRFGTVSGHHAMQVSRANDNLITGFEINTRFVHDITLSFFASGNVFSNGHGIDVSFDHHRVAPYENLFTDIDVGQGKHIWDATGNKTQGPNSGARETFWSIRSADAYLGWPSQESYGHQPWGPDQMNLIGLTTNSEPMFRNNKWFEVIDPGKLFPPDLHLAQLSRRLRNNRAGR